MALIQWLFDTLVFPTSMLTLIFVAPVLAVFRWLVALVKVVFPKKVSNKIVVITGASSGIGEALAVEYAKRGARLVLAARREERLRQNVEKCRRLGSPEAIYVRADVSQELDCRKIIDTAVDHFGGLDVVVCNAGTGMSDFFEDLSTEEINKIVATDLLGNVYPAYYALPHLRRSRGQLVVVASVGGFVPYPRQSVYNATKHAEIGLYDTVRVEAGSDVDVSIVCPGFIKSEMTEKLPLSQIGIWPLVETHDAARAIVRGTLHRRRYIVVPFWYSMFLYWRIFAPEVMDWTNRVLLGGERGRKGLLEYVFDFIEKQTGKASAVIEDVTGPTKQMLREGVQTAKEKAEQVKQQGKEAVSHAQAQAKKVGQVKAE